MRPLTADSVSASICSCAIFALSLSEEAIKTEPSSPTSIFVPVSSWRLRIVLPPGPIMAPIFSTGMFTTVILGTYGLSSGLGSGITSSILSKMKKRASRAC